MKNFTPQQLANKKQNQKRAIMRKISPYPLNDDEADLLDELALIHGSKKAAIIAGLKLLKEAI